MATIDAFLEYHKDPVVFAAKMEEFNAAEKKAAELTAKAQYDVDQAAIVLRQAHRERDDLGGRIVAFDRREQQLESALRRRAADQDERQAWIDERTKSIAAEEADQLRRKVAVQEREAEAARLTQDAREKLAAAETVRRAATSAIASMRAVLVDIGFA